MIKAYKFRIYPDKEQIQNLESTLNACRVLRLNPTYSSKIVTVVVDT